ncbi:MAG: helix-turn-helix domain-containing protein [Candidatus Peribacteria bacterium]|jgi:predicted transcriptional regulator|nr:helix-turn-helix domain-containing protein [Candidatus Peribacteria bacterium]
MLTNILQQQGLSPLEARVYLTTLELGLAPASQIARKLQENRVTVYSCLQALEKRGIVLTVTKNKVVHYSATSPKNLLKQAQEKTDLLSESMPELLAMSTLFGDKPSVQFYEGLDGLKMLYEDTLNYPGTTLKAFLGYEEATGGLKRYLNHEYLPARVKRKIKAQVLLSGGKEANVDYFPTNRADPSTKFTELRFVSDPIFSLSNEIDLYGNDKVAVMMFGETEMMGLLIKSKMLHTTLVSLFDLTWKRETDD